MTLRVGVPETMQQLLISFLFAKAVEWAGCESKSQEGWDLKPSGPGADKRQ